MYDCVVCMTLLLCAFWKSSTSCWQLLTFVITSLYEVFFWCATFLVCVAFVVARFCITITSMQLVCVFWKSLTSC